MIMCMQEQLLSHLKLWVLLLPPVPVEQCPPPSPPPPPPQPECLRPAAIVSSVAPNGCYQGNCGYWGPQKATDGGLSGFTSLFITAQSATGLIGRFDLGQQYSDLIAVDITSRSDGWIQQGQNLSVWVSSTTNHLATDGSALQCAVGVGPETLGETVRVLCAPQSGGVRYVTVERVVPAGTGSNYWFLSLQEVAAIRTGAFECGLVRAEAQACGAL